MKIQINNETKFCTNSKQGNFIDFLVFAIVRKLRAKPFFQPLRN